MGSSAQSVRDSIGEWLKSVEDQELAIQQKLLGENAPATEAILRNKLGVMYQKKGLLDSAQVHHLEAFRLSHSDSTHVEAAISLNKLGIISIYRADYSQAIQLLKRALTYRQSSKVSINIHNNLAIAYKYNLQPEKSIESYLKALEQAKVLEDSTVQLFVLRNIGDLYKSIENLEKSFEYFNQAYALALATGSKEAQVDVSTALAGYYQDIDSMDTAFVLFQEVLAYYEEQGSYSQIIPVKNNLAACYGAKGDIQNQLALYHEVIQLIDSTGFSASMAAVCFNVASVYMTEGELPLAGQYYRKALKSDGGGRFYHEKIYNGLIDYHSKVGQLDSALFIRQLQKAHNDSIDYAVREQKAVELEASHKANELQEKINQIARELDTVQNSKSRLSMWVWLSLAGLIVLGLLIIRVYNRTRKSEEKAADLTKLNTQLSSDLESKDHIIEKLEEAGVTKADYPENLDRLTEREIEILTRVGIGLKDQEIADELFISITTVRTHLRKAYSKIGVRNRAEVVQFVSKFNLAVNE